MTTIAVRVTLPRPRPSVLHQFLDDIDVDLLHADQEGEGPRFRGWPPVPPQVAASAARPTTSSRTASWWSVVRTGPGDELPHMKSDAEPIHRQPDNAAIHSPVSAQESVGPIGDM